MIPGNAITVQTCRRRHRSEWQTLRTDGVFLVPQAEVEAYYDEYRPIVLRRRRDRDTLGLPAINIGVAKGSTFDRVLLFPTKSMREYAESNDLSALTAKAWFYVAVTRARHSVGIVIE